MRRYLRIIAGIAGRGPRERVLRRAVAGRIVLVTGASEGIGAATARRLGAAGATVLLVARTTVRLEQVRDEITAAGGTAHVHPVDLADPVAAARLAGDLLRRYRRVDVVVSNAGRSIRRSVSDTADRFHDVQRTIDLNYLGPVALLLGLLPAMRAAGRGRIVNVSTAGLATPAPLWSAYLASKGAFDIWLRCAAPELRLDGVTTSTVYCGLVRTRMSAPTGTLRRTPAATPEEAAALVCRAVAHRHTSTLWPWWARPGELIATAFKGTVERGFAWQLRLARSVAPVRVLAGTGLLRPDRLLRILTAKRRYGGTLAAAVAAGPRTGTALVDAAGPMSVAELHAAADLLVAQLAPFVAAFKESGQRGAARVGVACLPGRGFVVTATALGRLGVHTVLLPPDLPTPALAALVTAQGIQLVVDDGQHEELLVPSVRWSAAPTTPAPTSRVPRPRRPGRLTVLTSGSTGAPRAVQRRLTVGNLLGPVSTHLRLVPLRPGRPVLLAAPPHHGYGLAYLAAGLTLGAPVLLAAGLEPEQTLALAAEHRASVLIGLPLQLRRLAGVGAPLPELRAIVSGAAPLPVELHARLVAAFGDLVYNLYGSTEAGWAAIATPADLAAAPGTVGRAPHGIRLDILGPAGERLLPGEVGEVQVTGWLAGGAPVRTGDRGHLDPVGRLHLHGRLDDMIVSGGENVYPAPVAATLASHPAVADVQISAVPDDDFGQRLRAQVRVRPGANVTDQELRRWLTERLSRAEQPRDIEVVADDPRPP